MNEDFVSFSLAKKLKEKGFVCKYPFAMYNEIGTFHPLYTSCDETLVNCVFGNRGYYDYDDFDYNDCIAPSISQVLKWLREEKKIHISITMYEYTWGYTIYDLDTFFPEEYSSYYNTYEAAALVGIEYCLNNLI